MAGWLEQPPLDFQSQCDIMATEDFKKEFDVDMFYDFKGFKKYLLSVFLFLFPSNCTVVKNQVLYLFRIFLKDFWSDNYFIMSISIHGSFDASIFYDKVNELCLTDNCDWCIINEQAK